MDKSEIERFVSKILREKINPHLAEAIEELNAQGHSFEVDEDGILEWKEPSSNKSIQITCILGVRCREQPMVRTKPDPITEAFIARAESGSDKDAQILNLLDMDINNGGLSQLYDNKGIKFIKFSASILEQIGSKQTLKLVNDAISLIENNNQTIINYEKLQKDLNKLDSKYYKLKESIPVLYENYKKLKS